MTRNLKSGLKRILKGTGKFLKWFGIFILLLLYILLGMVIYWYIRPNTSFIESSLNIESWVAVHDVIGHGHNSNSDMIFWNGSFYLVHQNSPFHLGSQKSKLMIWCSKDAKIWQLIKVIHVNEDVRDPKFAAIGSRLYLYALINQGLIARPFTTLYTYTEDGETWQFLKPIQPFGWLFWRPKTFDNITWYVPAYWSGHGASVLLSSTDGLNWTFVSIIYIGERNDETAIEFLPDGRMIATSRLEGYTEFLFGDNAGSTLIAVSKYPYKSWVCIKSKLTRLDGPRLFSYSGKIFAVGRFEQSNDPLINQRGSFFNKKRTSLFLVTELGLVYLSDLPSAGDTSYAGVVVKDNKAYISYYTSSTNRDIPWILGVISKSEIQMARIDLDQLVTLAEEKLSTGQLNNLNILSLPILDYFAFSLIITSEILIAYAWRKYKPLSKILKRKPKIPKDYIELLMI